MNWYGNIPVFSDVGQATKSTVIMRARQDWREGLSFDENPYTPGTVAFHVYHYEFDRLNVREAIQSLDSV